MLTIASWNVNSIRARLPLLIAWLKEKKPDIVLLQETKTINELFPQEEIEDLAYNIALSGQKTYNGVAILSKFPLEDITVGIPGFEDPQARYIEAVTHGVRVASVYVPNGGDLGLPSYTYKLSFLKQLYGHTHHLLTYDETLILGGDFNVAPSDEDVYDPQKWQNSILCSTPEREAFRALLGLGLIDGLRALYPLDKSLYTWWDYRARGWEANHGLRIDHFLLSPQAADRLQSGEVEKSLRGCPKPSDHAPIVCSLT